MEFVKVARANSVHGAEISAYTNDHTAKSYIYLISGVHGDEPEGVYVLDKLFAWLKTQNISTPFMVIPALNQDGLSAKTRVNANGVDLNRNWPSKDWSAHFTQDRYRPGLIALSEPENKFLHELFIKFNPSFIFSFHSWQRMLNHNAKALVNAEFIYKYNDYPPAADVGYPTPGSLGSYVDDVLGCGIITYELPVVTSELSLEEIWRENEIALQNYFLHFK